MASSCLCKGSCMYHRYGNLTVARSCLCSCQQRPWGGDGDALHGAAAGSVAPCHGCTCSLKSHPVIIAGRREDKGQEKLLVAHQRVYEAPMIPVGNRIHGTHVDQHPTDRLRSALAGRAEQSCDLKQIPSSPFAGSVGGRARRNKLFTIIITKGKGGRHAMSSLK